MRKNVRTCLVALLGATMVLGSFSVASAATVAPQFAFSDISQSPYASEINFLASQGFVSGDSGIGGPFRPTSNITRAEFIKIADMIAGLGTAAASLNTMPPKFTDGADIPSWAWGYVNAAQAKGMIYGYPDGTFRPNNNVTLVEAATVFLRLAGLSPAVSGAWPQGEIVAAAHYSIGADLQGNVDYNVPASRAQMATLAYDAYVKAPTGKVSQATGVFTDNNPPLIFSSPASSDYLTCTGVVQGVPTSDSLVIGGTLTNCNLPQSGGTVTGNFASQVWLNGATQFSQLAGATVLVTTDASHAVNYVEVKNVAVAPSTVSETLNDGTATVPSGFTAVQDNTGTVIPWLITDANGEYNLLFTDGKTQLLSNSATWYVNNDQVYIDSTNNAGAQFADNLPGASDTVSKQFAANTLVSNLSGNGLGVTSGTGFNLAKASWTVPQGSTSAATVYISKWTDNHALLTSLNAPSFTIAQFPSASQVQLTAGTNTAITLNGNAAQLSDLKANDVAEVAIYANGKVAANQSVVSIRATRNTIAGTVTAVSQGNNSVTLTVQLSDGTTKTVVGNGASLTAITPGTPIDLALDANGQAYWNLYNYGANWSPVVAEVTGTGRDSQGNYTVQLNSGGATTSYNLSSSNDQAGFQYILNHSQTGDPFVAVNSISSNVNDAVFASNNLYAGTSAGTGLDTSGKIEFTAGNVAGVTPLAPIFNVTAKGANNCIADSVPVGTNCSDVYKVYAVNASAGTVTLQELDGVSGAPTGSYISAYTANGLTAFTQANSAANTVGTYIGLSGLNVGEKVTLWGGGIDSANKVAYVDPGLTNGYYTPGSSTTGDGGKPVQVVGLVKQSS